MLSTRPRRRLMSPMISPMYSSGVLISIFMIGSSSCGAALSDDFLDGQLGADRKACSLESTAWKLPSSRTNLTSIIG